MKKYLLLLSLLPLLIACSGVKEQVGLGRKSPDEFAVVQRAPLSMPPGFELRPPEPGAVRPQDATSTDDIQKKLGVTNTDANSTGTASLLASAGASQADPDIRHRLDTESKGVVVKDKGFIDRLVNWNGHTAPDPIVDAEGEKSRIQNAKASGTTVGGANAVVIERKKKAPLEGIF